MRSLKVHLVRVVEVVKLVWVIIKGVFLVSGGVEKVSEVRV